ncbi:MAG: hypothetical protein K8T25_20430 [Planctomycetia bacterium]|nr:hypothetical protein [Planctomycetia bacterium]
MSTLARQQVAAAGVYCQLAAAEGTKVLGCKRTKNRPRSPFCIAPSRRAHRATPKSDTSYVAERADAALVVDAKVRKKCKKTQRIAMETQNNALKRQGFAMNSQWCEWQRYRTQRSAAQ